MPKLTKAVKLSPPVANTPAGIQLWMNSVYERVGEGPFPIQGYAKPNLPPANEWASTTSPNYFSSLIFVTNAGGATPMLAFSNGTDWIRVDTGVAV